MDNPQPSISVRDEGSETKQGTLLYYFLNAWKKIPKQ